VLPGGLPAGTRADSCGQAVARIALGPGEWVLVLLGGSNEAHPPAREVIRGLEADSERLAGGRYAITRTQPGVLDPATGPAFLHHSRARTVIYCAADQITAQAADALAALAARAAEFMPSAADRSVCEASVTCVGHGQLPEALHPAVATVRPSEITAYVCSHLITRELAGALGVLCTAYARRLAHSGPQDAGTTACSLARPDMTRGPAWTSWS
jgi:hypothetical protein